MIDSTVGLGDDLLVDNLRDDGIPFEKLRYLFVTHAHSDHACGVKFSKRTFRFRWLLQPRRLSC